jgi:hypothetical protein
MKITDEPSIGNDRTTMSEIAEKHDGQYGGCAAAEDLLMRCFGQASEQRAYRTVEDKII